MYSEAFSAAWLFHRCALLLPFAPVRVIRGRSPVRFTITLDSAEGFYRRQRRERSTRQRVFRGDLSEGLNDFALLDSIRAGSRDSRAITGSIHHHPGFRGRILQKATKRTKHKAGAAKPHRLFIHPWRGSIHREGF